MCQSSVARSSSPRFHLSARSWARLAKQFATDIYPLLNGRCQICFQLLFTPDATSSHGPSCSHSATLRMFCTDFNLSVLHYLFILFQTIFHPPLPLCLLTVWPTFYCGPCQRLGSELVFFTSNLAVQFDVFSQGTAT